VWFVTGASSGLGRAIAEAVLDRGERLAATARRPESIADLERAAPDRVACLELDVTDAASARTAVDAAVRRFGHIDVLVNNAGRGLIGAVEEVSEDQIARLFDVNVMGPLHVTRAALPAMRARGRGHIVQMSSVGGVRANPGHGLYAASKFALEGVSEALAGEVAPFGIKVLIVEPGPFRTDFAGRSLEWSTPLDAYHGTPAARLRERFTGMGGTQPNDPARAAAAIIDAVDSDDPPLRLALGPEAVEGIRTKLERQLDELAAWEDVANTTAFPD
jgi:NAD(P)-dependent dehydrogenase (short-subunit alcohol dehydrogenase family)